MSQLLFRLQSFLKTFFGSFIIKLSITKLAKVQLILKEKKKKKKNWSSNNKLFLLSPFSIRPLISFSFSLTPTIKHSSLVGPILQKLFYAHLQLHPREMLLMMKKERIVCHYTLKYAKDYFTRSRSNNICAGVVFLPCIPLLASAPLCRVRFISILVA